VRSRVEETMNCDTEVKSEKARNVILSHDDTVYFVSRVNVHYHEGDERHRAIFHARRATDDRPQDLELEINRSLYDVLVEYTKLDSKDHILILHIEGGKSKWCLMSENWLKNFTNGSAKAQYII
jgi:hypothetical protein